MISFCFLTSENGEGKEIHGNCITQNLNVVLPPKVKVEIALEQLDFGCRRCTGRVVISTVFLTLIVLISYRHIVR